MSPLYLFILVASAMAEDRHAVVYKSPTSMTAECQRYLGYPTAHPSEPHVPCQVACVALISRVWDNPLSDTRTVTSSRYIESDLAPKQYYERLQHCLAHVKQTVPQWDSCRRGAEIFNCFNQSISGIHYDRAFFIPKTDLQHRQVLADCIDFLQIPQQELDAILRQDFPNHPRGRCLLRCFLIREKLYSEAIGLAPYRVVVQLGDNLGHARSREDMRRCVHRLQRQYLDRCTLAARIAAECFGDLVWQLRFLLSDSSQREVLTRNVTSYL